MSLSGQQRQELQNALVNAFPDKSSLEQMLSFGPNINLWAIAIDGNLEEIVFELIKTAESQGWLKDLVRAAYQSNPGNSKLKAIAEELLTQSASDNAIRPNNPRGVRFLLFWLFLFFLGGGVAITLYFVIARQWAEAFASLSLTVILSLLTLVGIFLVELLNQLFQKSQLSLKQLAERLADALWSQVEVLAWEFTSPFQRQYYQSLIDSCRDYKTQGLKTKGEFTLALDKVFVPLKVLPKSPDKILPNMIRASSMTDNLSSIWDILVAHQKTSAYGSLAIIGAPGSGKTTLLQHLTLTYAKNTQRLQHREAPKLIPILLYLRDRNIQTAIFTAQSPHSLSELIEQQESIRQLNPPPQWFERKLCNQQCLVMLDGLDEVADSQVRRSLSLWINQQIQRYRKASFLLTSRPYGFKSESDSLSEIKTIVEVQPFNLKQVETFIHNWYLQREIMSHLGEDSPSVRLSAQSQSIDLMERIKNSPPLAAMALNPLLLTMIATVHCYRGALPGRRVELYAEICDVLLGRRQEAKGIPDVLTAEQKKTVLQVLALELMKQKTREFTPAQGYSLIQSELTKVASNNQTPEQFIKNIENVSGLLVEREKDRYEFAHKSFQEYLAAVQIKETNQESLLTTKINDDWWHETIRLYTAQSGATQIICAALDNPTVVSLKLALDCQEEGLRVEPKVRQQLADKLEAGLESSDREIFQLAANVKLVRRLSRLVRIDEKLEIDNDSYITYAEYQLFLDETGEQRQPQHWQSHRFKSGDAKKTISGIRCVDANQFCLWLKSWSEKQGLSSQLTELVTFYRLPTPEERSQHPIKNDQHLRDSGIRLVKFQLPSKYSQLADYLLSGEWRKADEETANVMLKVAGRENQGYLDVQDIENFPCSDLRIIDQLWVSTSKGLFGFSVQKNIYQSLGGTREYNERIWNAFGDRVGWRTGGNEGVWFMNITYTFDESKYKKGHLPSYGIDDKPNYFKNVYFFSRAETCRL
jgi:predicted NACHT family NTPase